MADAQVSAPEATEPDDAGAAPPWHALPFDEVVEELDTDHRAGLSEDDAAQRLEEHGPNELGKDEPRGDLEILLHQFTSPLIYILLVAFVVTILIDEYTDAAVIAAVLVINAIIGFIQERKADRSVHALMQMAAPRSTVVRGEQEQEVDAVDLVPGDVVLLTSGTRVPADLRLVRTTSLQIDESLLTGESKPARKSTDPVAEDALAADQSSMAFMGSAVTSGRARGVVVATALDTQLGTIAESIRSEEKPETPLQQRMNRFANIIAVAVLASTVLAFGMGYLLTDQALDELFLTAVALAVAVVPEGLPVAFTVAMALGVRRMAERNAIIRSLPAVETLGSTNTIGSDKTGTLTANRMTLVRGWTPDGWVHFLDPEDVDDDDEAIAAADHLEDHPDGALASSVRTAVVTSEAELVVEDGEVVDQRGDPTEVALLAAARAVGRDPRELREEVEVLAHVPFESDLRYSFIVADEDGPVLRLKGAPERVVELCSHVRHGDDTRELDPDEILSVAERMAEQGLRVLALAERRFDAETADTIDEQHPPEPDELVLTGLVGMQDPPRSGVKEAIARARQAGIRVIMITGDHAVTASAIADQLGLSEEPATRTGADVERMSDEELRQAVLEVDVFARVAPDHKLRVVRALRSHDQVVAVTGDGVNDGPALKAADIGVAMGRDGTDVAREASDMVLTDDNFVSIANAVEEGRVVFENVRKVTFFLLSTGAAAIVAILTSIAAGLPLPYVPAALLWLNVVTNGLQDVALAFEKGEPDVLDRPPRRREDPIVNAVLWERTALTGITMALGSLWVFLWAIDADLTDAQQRGAALTTLVVAMAAHVYNARSERRSIVVTNVRGNPFLLASTVVALTIHLLASYWGPTQTVLQIEPVTAGGWSRIAVVTVAVVLVSEAHKAVRSRTRHPAETG
ncbi:MAG: cation-translocating P-type ATPase [Nitriliruptoraceae bacterium]